MRPRGLDSKVEPALRAGLVCAFAHEARPYDAPNPVKGGGSPESVS